MTVTLPNGQRFDRYGHAGGTFVAPEGTVFEMRSMPTEARRHEFHTYEVIEPFEAEIGMVRPWYGQPGGGMQARLPMPIADLLKAGWIREMA